MFPLRFPLYLCLVGPGNGFLFLVQQARVRTQLLFQGEEPDQASRISGFWVINVDVGFGRCASSGTHFAALAVAGVLLTRVSLLGNIFLSNLGGMMCQGCQKIG